MFRVRYWAVLFAVSLAVDGRATARDIYTGGHADLGIAYNAGAFDLHIHVHPSAVVNGVVVGADDELSASSTLIFLPWTSIVSRPAGVAFDFIGVAAGANFSRTPQSLAQANLEGAPFFGIGAEEIALGDFVGDTVNIALVAINGPAGGNFSLFQNPSTRFMDTLDGNFANDAFDFPALAEDHFNWAFTQPGYYDVDIRVSGTHVVDGFVSTIETYRFFVSPVPEPSSVLLVSLAAIGGGLWIRSRRRGTATQADGLEGR